MSDVISKVVVDISQKYFSIYLCDAKGVVQDSDHFRWPYRLEIKDARQEAKDAFSLLYDWANETMNADELQEGDRDTEDAG